MEEVNKNRELDNTDKKLHISDVSERFNQKIDERIGKLEMSHTKKGILLIELKQTNHDLSKIKKSMVSQ